MATTSTEFMPELWSQELMDRLKENVIFGGRPRRDKATQMLRDAALGHPEFPDEFWGEVRFGSSSTHMTATEVNIRHEYAQRAAEAMAADFDSHILDSLVYSIRNGK